MTVHLKLDLNSPAELDAFGAFCIAVAADKRANPPKASIYDRLWGLGGIDKASNSSWQARTASDETSEAPVSDTADAVVFAFDPAKLDLMNSTASVPQAPDQPIDGPKPTRERGKPSPGHKRRTNAEIAEDEAFLAGVNTELNEVLSAAADATPAISTGEERVGPEDTVEDQAQDAADEAAEADAAKAETGGKLSLDDVRNVLGLYVKGYGLAAAQEDGPKIITEVCGDGKVKVSDIPDDKIADVIAAVKAAGKANRFSRTAVVA